MYGSLFYQLVPGQLFEHLTNCINISLQQDINENSTWCHHSIDYTRLCRSFFPYLTRWLHSLFHKYEQLWSYIVLQTPWSVWLWNKFCRQVSVCHRAFLQSTSTFHFWGLFFQKAEDGWQKLLHLMCRAACRQHDKERNSACALNKRCFNEVSVYKICKIVSFNITPYWVTMVL